MGRRRPLGPCVGGGGSRRRRTCRCPTPHFSVMLAVAQGVHRRGPLPDLSECAGVGSQGGGERWGPGAAPQAAARPGGRVHQVSGRPRAPSDQAPCLPSMHATAHPALARRSSCSPCCTPAQSRSLRREWVRGRAGRAPRPSTSRWWLMRRSSGRARSFWRSASRRWWRRGSSHTTSAPRRWWRWWARRQTSVSPGAEWPELRRGVPGWLACGACEWLLGRPTASDRAHVDVLVRVDEKAARKAAVASVPPLPRLHPLILPACSAPHLLAPQAGRSPATPRPAAASLWSWAAVAWA